MKPLKFFKDTLASIPDVFTLIPDSDYSRYVPKGGAAQLMRENWERTGKQLRKAIEKVGREIDEQQAQK